MELGPVFRKLRTTAFSCIIAVSFVWTVLLCVDLFVRWDSSDPTQRNIVLVLVIINAITVVMLPVLLIVRFRAWLDCIRFIFLIFAHVAIAAAYTLWYPKYQCPTAESSDDVAVCRVFNMYILIASWINPALLISYAICLAIAVQIYYRRGGSSSVDEMEKNGQPDEENVVDESTRRPSVLPIMSPPPSAIHTPTDRHSFSNNRMGSSDMARHSIPHPSRHLSLPATAVAGPSTPEGQRKQSFASTPNDSPRSSGRLSKPLPAWAFE